MDIAPARDTRRDTCLVSCHCESLLFLSFPPLTHLPKKERGKWGESTPSSSCATPQRSLNFTVSSSSFNDPLRRHPPTKANRPPQPQPNCVLPSLPHPLSSFTPPAATNALSSPWQKGKGWKREEEEEKGGKSPPSTTILPHVIPQPQPPHKWCMLWWWLCGGFGKVLCVGGDSRRIRKTGWEEVLYPGKPDINIRRKKKKVLDHLFPFILSPFPFLPQK